MGFARAGNEPPGFGVVGEVQGKSGFGRDSLHKVESDIRLAIVEPCDIEVTNVDAHGMDDDRKETSPEKTQTSFEVLDHLIEFGQGPLIFVL